MTNAFWKTMWLRMRSRGWMYGQNMDYDFDTLRFFFPPHLPCLVLPPAATKGTVGGGRDDEDTRGHWLPFYEDIGGITNRLSRDDNDDQDVGRVGLLEEFAAAIVATRAKS